MSRRGFASRVVGMVHVSVWGNGADEGDVEITDEFDGAPPEEGRPEDPDHSAPTDEDVQADEPDEASEDEE